MPGLVPGIYVLLLAHASCPGDLDDLL